MDDIQYMRAALDQARRGLGRVAPNPSVGCVIVKKGIVLAQAHTADGGRPHAETIALEKAGREAKDATAYVTLEPCSHHGKTGPCAEALVKAGVARVVVACTDPDPRVSGRGIEILKNAGIEVVTGVREDEAQALNRGFFLKVTEHRPLVTLKAATTKDGKITPEAGRQWITGEMARRHVHLERSMHDAILVGIGTVLKDNPSLTTRLEGTSHEIIRIVLDSNLKIPLESRLVQGANKHPLWVFYKDAPAGTEKRLEQMGVRLFPLGDIGSTLATLAEEGITRLLVEGGPKIWAAFIRAGLYDRLLWYRAPRVAGEGQAAFTGLDPAKGLKLSETLTLGEDLLEIYEKAA